MNHKSKHRGQTAEPKGATIQSDSLSDSAPARHEIAVLAYSYWEARDHQGGSAEEDWVRAEEELRKRQSRRSAPKESAAAAKGAGA